MMRFAGLARVCSRSAPTVPSDCRAFHRNIRPPLGWTLISDSRRFVGTSASWTHRNSFGQHTPEMPPPAALQDPLHQIAHLPILPTEGTGPGLVENDFTRCTSEVYATKECAFAPQFEKTRRTLDYSYHPFYTLERQRIQDAIIHRTLSEVKAKNLDYPCIVFTAGPMGSGKGHVLRYWDSRGVFPAERFVISDPDHYKWQLPDMMGYIKFDENSAGSKTRKESGLISEIVTTEALQNRYNIIVDGTLRDVEWYTKYFTHIRQTYPQYCIAILHVLSSPDNVIARAQRRGEITGRHVPLDLLKKVIQEVPESVKVLSNLAHCLWEFDNNLDHDETPSLVNMQCSVDPAKLGDLIGLYQLWKVEGGQKKKKKQIAAIDREGKV